MNIYSFVPSATEMVYLLGLEKQLAGVTYQCDYPAKAKEKPVVVHSTFNAQEFDSHHIDILINKHINQNLPVYTIDYKLLEQRNPDLILTQALCEVCAIPERQVLISINDLPGNPRIIRIDPINLNDVLQAILDLGKATDAGPLALDIVGQLQERITQITKLVETQEHRTRVICLEWLDPPMVAGHWISEMIELAGGIDCLNNRHQPAKKVDWDSIVEAQPDVLILMPCGFGIDRTLKEGSRLMRRNRWDTIPAVKTQRVWVTDANSYFSRSGPRLVTGLEILARILHPELFISVIDSSQADLLQK